MAATRPAAPSLASALGALDALHEATQAIARVMAVEDVLQLIVERVRPLVGARYAALGIVGPDGTIDRFVTSGLTDEERRRIGALPRGHGLLGLIIRENRAFRIRDIATDERRHGFPAHHPPMHTFLGVPVTVRGRSVGNLYLTEKEGGAEFTPEDQQLVETFALHAAIAIENARLHEQVQRLAVIEERDRIGQDLHDGIIQSIYAVGLSLEDVPELMREAPEEAEARVERAIESLHLAIRDIRNFIYGLRPELLGEISLLGGLAALVDEIRRDGLIEAELHVYGEPSEPGSETTPDLLAIVHEALTNVAKHARASQAVVEVSSDAGGLTISVLDDGIGVPADRTGTIGHQGMRSMQERSERLGAQLSIAGKPNGGTQVSVRLPRGGGRREEPAGG
ncbi:MAG TPA: GAF domain-containing sensor histidine kinase [Candidatus Limnocylindrales bacterium]|nr:GAF domain-containing sensor histidine kinase [Candidatus Limnocylindrales bacterium]